MQAFRLPEPLDSGAGLAGRPLVNLCAHTEPERSRFRDVRALGL